MLTVKRLARYGPCGSLLRWERLVNAPLTPNHPYRWTTDESLSCVRFSTEDEARDAYEPVSSSRTVQIICEEE